MTETLDRDEKALQERKRRQEEFLERVESNLRRSEKDIWFLKNEDHPQKESLSNSVAKSAHK
jgi:hypothetical protein